MICCDKALAKLGMKKEATRVVIQGFGNVGSMAGADAESRLQDHRACRHRRRSLQENGFDVPKLIDWVQHAREGAAGLPWCGTKMSSRDVLFQKCDVLIPSGDRKSNYGKERLQVQAKVMCEGANGPTTCKPTRLLMRKACSRTGHSWQRRRRDGQLLEWCKTARLFLAGKRSKRAAARRDGECIDQWCGMRKRTK